MASLHMHAHAAAVHTTKQQGVAQAEPVHISIQHEAADGKTGGKPKLIVRLSRPHNTPAPTHAPSAAHSHWPRKIPVHVHSLARQPFQQLQKRTSVVVHHTTQPIKPLHIQPLRASAGGTFCSHCRLPSCLGPWQLTTIAS